MRFAWAICLVLLPSFAVADIQRCDRPVVAHSAAEEQHRDHGDGIISFVSWVHILHDGIGGAREDLNLVSCRTATTVAASLRVRSFHTDAGTGELVDDLLHDVSDATLARFEELLVSDREFSLSEVAAELARVSPAVDVTTSLTNQPCGCAMAYPMAGRYLNTFDRSELR